MDQACQKSKDGLFEINRYMILFLFLIVEKHIKLPPIKLEMSEERDIGYSLISDIMSHQIEPLKLNRPYIKHNSKTQNHSTCMFHIFEHSPSDSFLPFYFSNSYLGAFIYLLVVFTKSSITITHILGH